MHIAGVFPVFADFSDSSTSERSISGSRSRMWCAKKLWSPLPHLDLVGVQINISISV